MLLAAAALGASLAQGSPTPPRFPATVITDVGGSPFVSENDGDADLTGVQVFVAGGLESQPENANGVASLVAETIVQTPVQVGSQPALPARDAIAHAGGTLSYTIDGRTAHYYIEGRPSRMVALLGAFDAAIAKPDFSALTVNAARKTLDAQIGQSEGNPLAVGIQMFKRSYYLNGAGSPAMGSAATLAQIGEVQLRAFYLAAYRRGGLSVSAVGRVTPELTGSLRALANALPPGAPAPVSSAVKQLSTTNGTRIIAQRDVAAPFLVVGFGAPAPADKDFGPMLLIESLLATSFDRSVATTPSLAQRTISAFYLYDSTPASFVVFVNGARVEPTLALREVLLVTESLASKPLDPDALTRFKAAATGAFVSDALTLADRSYLIGTLQRQGLGADAMNVAIAAVAHTSADDVQRVAKHYLQKYIVAIVLPRSGQSGQ
jgi:predicted Zn-dependent peptidase